MKVILNDDVRHLGELGDIKTVANGYARNYLLPHGFAVIYNDSNKEKFAARKAEIEERKAAKRRDSASLKDKLEGTTVELLMSAGANGKLYGAVTNQTIAEYLAKNGFEVERKRIEIPGVTIKSVGNYSFNVHLYESTVAQVKLVVKAQEEIAKGKKEIKEVPAKEKAQESK